MTNLNDWAKAVEIDFQNEAQKLHNAINLLQGNDVFSISKKTEEGSTIIVIAKVGFRPLLEIKSDLARTKILLDISNDYLPLTSLK